MDYIEFEIPEYHSKDGHCPLLYRYYPNRPFRSLYYKHPYHSDTAAEKEIFVISYNLVEVKESNEFKEAMRKYKIKKLKNKIDIF